MIAPLLVSHLRSRGWVVLALAAAACASAPAGPPEVQWGVDECSHCHMILSDPRFAAVARSDAGEEARFDDLGCLASYVAARSPERWRTWVHASDGERWLAAADAWFVRLGAHTPMGSGIAAFASEQAARAAAAAAPMRFTALLSQSNRQPAGGAS